VEAWNDKCEKCGEPLPKQQLWRRRSYCSRECFNDARFGDRIRYGNIETRRPLVIAAAKLIQSGLTQVQAAQALDVHPRQISDWVERYGAENFYPEHICCQHCGKSLAGMNNLSNRKYCSRSCQQKARYARNRPSERQKMKFDPALRARALELYWGGLGQTTIAQHLGVATGTVDSWVHNFGGLRECRPTKEAMALRTPEERFRAAETADEWLEALCGITPKKAHAGKTILLSLSRRNLSNTSCTDSALTLRLINNFSILSFFLP